MKRKDESVFLKEVEEHNKNKINLIRIPYWDINNIDTILSDKLAIM